MRTVVKEEGLRGNGPAVGKPLLTPRVHLSAVLFDAGSGMNSCSGSGWEVLLSEL